MDSHHRELANRLFATATAMIEDATEIAVAGQSSRLTRAQLADHGRRLQVAAQDIAIIADAAATVANLDIDEHRNPRKRSH